MEDDAGVPLLWVLIIMLLVLLWRLLELVHNWVDEDALSFWLSVDKFVEAGVFWVLTL